MRKVSSTWALALGLIGAVGMTCSAQASENGLFGGPIGGSDIRSAYLPPQPGLYVASVLLGTTGGSYNGDDRTRDRTKDPAALDAENEGIGALYVYPFKVLGGTVSSSFQLAYQELCQEIGIGGGHKLSGCNNGFADSYADVVFWSRKLTNTAPGGSAASQSYTLPFGIKTGALPYPLPYGLTIGGGLGLEIPLGAYSSTAYVNEGKGTFIYIPNVALTYFTGPRLSLGGDGTEVSARLYYETSDPNDATHYQGGDIFDIDWAVTERYGRLQLGIAGAYANQTTQDTKAGVVVQPDGLHYGKLIAGPVIAYDSARLGATFKLKATAALDNRNTYNLDTAVFVVSKKF